VDILEQMKSGVPDGNLMTIVDRTIHSLVHCVEYMHMGCLVTYNQN
jgi:hypothetical protein